MIYSNHALLDRGYLASQYSRHVGRCSLLVYKGKGSRPRCFGQVDAKGSAITAFKALAVHRHVVLTRFLFPGLPCGRKANVSIYYKCYWKEWAGWCAWACSMQCDFVSMLDWYFASFIQCWAGLACYWHLWFSYLNFFGTSLYIQGFKSSYPFQVMPHFYLQHPPCAFSLAGKTLSL